MMAHNVTRVFCPPATRITKSQFIKSNTTASTSTFFKKLGFTKGDHFYFISIVCRRVRRVVFSGIAASLYQNEEIIFETNFKLF